MTRSTSARTIQFLEERKYIAQVVETWVPYATRRRDLFGFGDVLAVGPDVIIAQATSISNVSSRINKILESSKTRTCLNCPGVRIIVFGWSGTKMRLVEVLKKTETLLRTRELEDI